MDEWYLDLFVGEVQRQADFALIAFMDLQDALSNRKVDKIWYSTQGLLVAAGNVSKLLWPMRGNSAKRGKDLRKALGIRDNSPLKPRTFRNHFEHYDERLEDWMISSERHNIVDSCVMSPGAIVGVDEGDFLRILDPIQMTLAFRGDRYNLQPLVAALEDMKTRAKVRLSTKPTVSSGAKASSAYDDMIRIATRRCRNPTRREALIAAMSVVSEIQPGPLAVDEEARTEMAERIADKILELWPGER